jgi:hypothetical protein
MSEKLKQVFDQFDDDYLKFEDIAGPLHRRPDVCAFLLLDHLVPGRGKAMVTAAEHDEIFLGIDIDALTAVCTERDVQTLVRCGVRYDSESTSLAMFV